MKHKIISISLIILIILLSTSGCGKKTSKTNVNMEEADTHKIIVVVVDKETKSPIKEAKVSVLGQNTTYTTDDMGKTPELDVELNKEYFKKYSEEITSRMRSGFVNVAVIASGYAKHLEADYNVFPGGSISIVRVELTKGKSYTVNSNAPDISYVENLLKAYENYESKESKESNSDKMVKCKISIVDENNKPIEGAKLVIPEANAVNNTDKKGICELNIPYVEENNITYPVNKGYGEITVLAYKEGYLSKAVIREHVSINQKINTKIVKMKKSNKYGVECEIVRPGEEWVKGVLDSIK